MRRILIVAATASLGLITACSGGESENGGEARAVTQTRMDDIDKIEGSISDEMIDTNESGEEAPLAGSDAIAGAANPEAAAAQKPENAEKPGQKKAEISDNAR